MSGTTVLIVESLGALALGHAPALFARYGVKKAPLALASAVFIGVTSSVLLGLAMTAAHEAFGFPQLRMTASLVGVSAMVSIGTMVQGKRERLISRLQEMIADPATTAPTRELALDRLQKLSRVSNRPPRRPLNTDVGDVLRSASGEDQPDRLLSRTAAGSGTRWTRLRGYGRYVVYAAGAALALNMLLMASGYRVLIHQRIVESGQEYFTDEWIFGSEAGVLIVCRYWTGRSVKPTAMRYGPGGNEVDECPAFFAPTGPAS